MAQPHRVFISNPKNDDLVVKSFAENFRALGLTPIFSPDAADLGWKDWYRDGCARVLSAVSAFVAVNNNCYDDSTWMQHEALEAVRLSRAEAGPLLFLHNESDRKLPAGFSPLASSAMILPKDPRMAAQIVAQRIEYRRAQLP